MLFQRKMLLTVLFLVLVATKKQPVVPSVDEQCLCVCCVQSLEDVLKYCNYVFTFIFVIEALLKLVAFGIHRFFKDR